MVRTLLFTAFSLAFFQPAQAQQRLADRLPVFKTPLVIDSTFKPAPVKFTREELWNELIRPMQTKVNKSFEEYILDSAEIDQLNQWQGLNLEKQETAVPYRTKDLNGEVFLLGKVKLPNELMGWVWG